MFDIGFSELLLIAVIALIVIGPERLPRVARTLGYWTGRMRAYARNFTAELERQADVTDLRNSIHPDLQQARDELRAASEQIKNTVDDAAGSGEKGRAGQDA